MRFLKNIIAIVVLFISCILCGYGQIFSGIIVYDKFDDVISSREIKTLITWTDSTIVVEEKGSVSVEYIILRIDEDGCLGSRDNIVEIVDGVYGYQTACIVVKASDVLDKITTKNGYRYTIKEGSSYRMVNRYVSSSKYSYDYSDEYLWLQDKNGQRRIYIR